MTIIDIARVCHEVNRAFCVSLGDLTQVTWEEAPEWQMHSAISGVNFHIQNPNAGAEASHENWLKLKTKEGWIFGAVKNAEKKTHPCCVPFHELPQSQQAKDVIFRQIVHSLKKEL